MVEKLLARMVIGCWLLCIFKQGLMTLGASTRRYRKKYNVILEEAYLSSHLSRIVWAYFWRASIALALVVAMAYTLTVMIQPVYVFTDYIPAILVEPTEIAKTFWSIQEKNAVNTVYRTSNAIRISFISGICNAGAIVCLVGILRIRHREGVIKQ